MTITPTLLLNIQRYCKLSITDNHIYGVMVSVLTSPTLLLNIRSYCKLSITDNHIYGVMVSVLTSSAVHRGFEPLISQTKDYKIGICFFSAKKRKSKDGLARNQDNVSEWDDMSIQGVLFQWASTQKIKEEDLIILSLKINLFPPWYSWKIAELAFNNNHSPTHSFTCRGLSILKSTRHSLRSWQINDFFLLMLALLIE
jgi:hypothetical protein